MNTELETDAALASQGSREAFVRLMRAMEVPMYQMARAIVKKDEDCADAIQEAMLKAFQAMPALKEPSYFRTWLFRILINECNAILRKRNRVVPMHDLPQAESLSQPDGSQLDLREAVDRLEPIARTIVVLHYYNDLPLGQIGDILEMSEGAVKTRLHRARQTLAQWLSDTMEREGS
ncbi:sigma-70 family RNA polymerase sigma factor [Paenibacillus aurantiacus]|uniref:Sigma-70 family RNA polymerase sigma factor n=1 Tax=Paenibacillus aurantiacus TaxID=1936118 RepID=A0ABV5KU53_9BACL